MTLIIRLLLVLLLITPPAFAANHYVLDGGSGDGSAWDNAWDDLPATLTRGDTYYIGDGTYVGYEFDDAESGTDIITIKKAISTDHGTETGWDSAYGDGQAQYNGVLRINNDYYTIDGQTGGGPGSWKSGHGIKIYTASGSDSISIGNATDTGVNNIILEHLEIQGHGIDQASYQSGIKGAYGNDESGITIGYCYIYNHFKQIIQLDHYEDIIIEYSYLGPNGDHDTYDGGNTYHGIGITFRDNNGVDVRYNHIVDISETAIIGLVNDTTSEVATDWRIYGNLFYQTGDITIIQPFVLRIARGNTAVSGMQFHNNTIANASIWNPGISSIGSDGGGNEAYNNMYYDLTCTSFTYAYTHDYNYVNATTYSPSEANLQTDTGDPFTDSANADYTLNSATDDGDSTIGATYNTDMSGATRGSDSVWDRGAFEYNGTGVASTGTALDSITEADIVAGSKTVIFTATNTTWVATMGDDSAPTTAFLAIFDGNKSGAGYWDDEVTLAHGNLVRTSDTVLTLTLPATAAYDCAETETVSFTTIPATATAYGETINTSPSSFTIGVIVPVTPVVSKTGVYSADGVVGTYNADGITIN